LPYGGAKQRDCNVRREKEKGQWRGNTPVSIAKATKKETSIACKEFVGQARERQKGKKHFWRNRKTKQSETTGKIERITAGLSDRTKTKKKKEATKPREEKIIMPILQDRQKSS